MFQVESLQSTLNLKPRLVASGALDATYPKA